MLFLWELTSVERNSRKHLLYTLDLPRWEMGLKQMGNISLILSQSKAQKEPEPEFLFPTVDVYPYTNQCHVFHILSHSIYAVALDQCLQFTCYYTSPNREQGEDMKTLNIWRRESSVQCFHLCVFAPPPFPPKYNLLSLHVLKVMLLKLGSRDGDLRNVYHPAMRQSTKTEREYLGKKVTLQ